MEKGELKKLRRILYNIDMVNGFVKEGVLHDERIKRAIPEQLKLIDRFIDEKQGIAFIKDNHKLGCEEFKTFPPHCVIGTSEAELVDELKPYEQGSLIYPKNSTSAIFAPNVLNDLNQMTDLVEVVGVGCCTDICVLNFLVPLINYFNQMNRKMIIFAVKNAIETYNIPGVHDAEYYNKIAYDLMSQAGIHVVEDHKELEEKEREYGIVLEKRR